MRFAWMRATGARKTAGCSAPKIHRPHRPLVKQIQETTAVVEEWNKFQSNILATTIVRMPRPFNKRKDKIWIHPPEVLILGSVLYSVKFLGSREVDQPKGSDIVKDAVNKLKFTRHIKKAEGQKLQKVELHISVHIVRIVQQKSKELLHSIPLNHISFCADDKVDKRMLAFVCRDVDKNRNLCYAFDSDKCAKEIALTIGQAFEVAYRQYVDSGARDAEFRKQMASLCQRVVNLETENGQLKKQVQGLKDMFESTQSGLERSVETKRPNSLLLQPCLTLPNTELSTLFVPPGKTGGHGEKSTRAWGEHANSKYAGVAVGIKPMTSCIPGEVVNISPPWHPQKTGSKSPDSGVTDIFDMEPFSPLFSATDLQPESDESEAESLSPRSVKAEHDSPVGTTFTAADDNTGSLSETANGPVFISQFCLPDHGFQFSNLHTGSKWMSMDSQCLTLLRHHWG
ncbi:uncharacterized protein LOC144720543 [Lampetra planeri]